MNNRMICNFTFFNKFCRKFEIETPLSPVDQKLLIILIKSLLEKPIRNIWVNIQALVPRKKNLINILRKQLKN